MQRMKLIALSNLGAYLALNGRFNLVFSELFFVKSSPSVKHKSDAAVSSSYYLDPF